MQTTTNTKKLTQLSPGEQSLILKYEEETTETLRLQEMGLLPGTPITLIRQNKTNNLIEIQARGYHLALRKEEGNLIWIQNNQTPK